jgi:putative SOS response-associated peptidase YedK
MSCPGQRLYEWKAMADGK